MLSEPNRKYSGDNEKSAKLHGKVADEIALDK